MKALSIKQPWAWLIVAGYKRIENRTWTTSHRGPLAIHAGKSFDVEGWLWVRENFPQIQMPHPDNHIRGAIVGTATLSGVVTRSDDPWFCGPYGWMLSSPQPLMTPIVLRGQLGLFDVKIETYVKRRADEQCK